MVRGLEKFTEIFSPYSNQYVLIGGTACTIAMEEAELDFRATKDLDIVLYVEALDDHFLTSFWKFIDDGAYQYRQKSTGVESFYRFFRPEKTEFPWMLELFSRLPDGITFYGEGSVTPIPTGEEIASLSAILLDDDYYGLVHEGAVIMNELPIVKPTHLIPLKVQAWADLSSRKAEGGPVDGKDIRKHRNDVFRLYQLLTAGDVVMLPERAKESMIEFVRKMPSEEVNFNQLGIHNTNREEILSNLSRIYLSH